jgi:hypothetical protein
MIHLIQNLEKADHSNTEYIEKGLKIVNHTVAGLLNSKDKYTDYSYEKIIKNLQVLKFAILEESYDVAQKAVEVIKFESNNHF